MALGVLIDKENLFIWGIPLWVVVRTVYILADKKRGLKVSFLREVSLGVFIVYILGVIGVTLFPIEIIWDENEPSRAIFSVNYVPFRQLIQDVSQLGNGIFSFAFHIKLLLKNIGGNLILLTPLGMMLPMLWKRFRTIKNCLLFGFLTSLSIETLQVIEGVFGIGRFRIADVDDLILNSIGVMVGYLIFKVMMKAVLFCKTKLSTPL
ncbi:MAG: VanZ family protein [Clostridia bacterium]|nr:VanZ family protein [Clostridia bacterium]